MSKRLAALPVLALFLIAATQRVDPLAEEIAKWSAFVHADAKLSGNAEEARQSMKPGIERTEKALKENRRWLALQRLFVVRPNIAATVYSESRPPAEHTDQAK